MKFSDLENSSQQFIEKPCVFIERNISTFLYKESKFVHSSLQL